jgi:poly-gamma-glutamate capsule biosynthesis protein CapA/YwtB (metallophosphatase superfamily)
MYTSFQEFTTIRLSFFGDIMLHAPQMEPGIKWDWSEVAEVVADSDLRIGNFESTFMPGTGNILDEEGIHFRAPIQFLRHMEQFGMDVLVVQNNHMYDFGEPGFRATMEAIEASKIAPVAYNETFTVRGQRIQLINFTTHLNNLQHTYSIPPADRSANFNIAFVHWGGQYTDGVNWEQFKVEDELQAAGYSIIIGSGPHQRQRWISAGDTFTAYSLGDFFAAHADERGDNTGYVLNLSLNANGVAGVEMFPVQTITADGVSRIKITK